MSIPRDTYAPAYYVPKINSAYGAVGGGEKGMEQLMEQVKNVVGFMPDGYALVNLSAFVEAVDLLGGLDFDVPMDMDYDDPDQNLFIHLKAGEQHLTGEQLMWVVRFRSGYANADIGRTEVQRAVMKTAMKQWLRPKTLAALPGLWRIYQENPQTGPPRCATSSDGAFEGHELYSQCSRLRYHGKGFGLARSTPTPPRLLPDYSP